jgi:hypothetical protein
LRFGIAMACSLAVRFCFLPYRGSYVRGLVANEDQFDFEE